MGWSCGKETLKDGRYDTLKGSYYVNPVQNERLQEQAVQKYPKLPEYTAPNMWPREDVLPGFQSTFEELSRFIINTAALVARACDAYAQGNIPDYQEGILEHVVKTSITTKARLLHYFPSSAKDQATSESTSTNDDDDDDDWCATHLDHGCLTGLTSAMFIDETQHPPHSAQTASHDDPCLPELAGSPDPNAGLYIHARSGKVTKVDIPRDCLAFQTGEALEGMTKGRFRAVPHFVKGVSATVDGGVSRVARNTLAVFTQVRELVGHDFLCSYGTCFVFVFARHPLPSPSLLCFSPFCSCHVHWTLFRVPCSRPF